MRVLRSSNNKQFAVFSESRRHLQRLQKYSELFPFAEFITKNCLYNQQFKGYLLLYEFPTVGHRRLFARAYSMQVGKAQKAFTESELREKAAANRRKNYRKQRKTKIVARRYARIKYRTKIKGRKPLMAGAAAGELVMIARHYARTAALEDLI